ncbi:cell wall-binding repeat-containing protein [Herbiconiux sp. YIM B11900]|uniref:cell wall-binding repeat-containing protein n=1 Tax=Herbiconiux sp. YIM B11900 TaxID=3404131 RepID=UPI003F84AE07
MSSRLAIKLSAIPMCVILGALLPAGAISSAIATEPARHVTLESSGEVSVPSSDVYSVAVDDRAGRAYVVEWDHSVDVLDITSGKPEPVATITAGLSKPRRVTVDPASHRVFVVDAGAVESVKVIDGDPASPTIDQVVDTFPTGGTGGYLIGLDPGAGLVYVTNSASKDASIIDLTARTNRTIPIGDVAGGLAVDTVGHRAFFSNTASSSIVTFAATDGSYSSAILSRPPRVLEFVEGRLLVAVDTAFNARIIRYDPASWRLEESSAELPTQPDAIVTDPVLHVTFLSYAAADVPGMQALRTSSLEFEAVSGAQSYYTSLATGSSGQLVAIQRTSSFATRVTSYRVLISPLPSVDRIAGADRFAVSANVAADAFSSGVPVAYVASGASFADALSASAAAGARGGPVLLVGKDSLPSPVAARLTALRPRSLIVLGGTASVSSAVETQLRALVPSVTRIGGADRFEVSAAVAADAFPAGAKTVYLASGAVFPDALSGSAAAGHEGSPVLLVQKDAVPTAVSAELDRLAPQVIIVLGGPNTIDESVVQTLQQRWPVIRIAGADRYEVSAAVASRMAPRQVFTVYVASGEVFPDALSGSAAAIDAGAPVLLITHDSVPASVAAEIQRLKPYRIVVLGGPSTISDEVVAGLGAYLPD